MKNTIITTLYWLDSLVYPHMHKNNVLHKPNKRMMRIKRGSFQYHTRWKLQQANTRGAERTGKMIIKEEISNLMNNRYSNFIKFLDTKHSYTGGFLK